VHPHAYGEPRAQDGDVLLRRLAQVLPQVQRCQYGAPGVVLLGHGSAKHGGETLRRVVHDEAGVALHHLVG
jgi:hypothetical protein